MKTSLLKKLDGLLGQTACWAAWICPKLSAKEKGRTLIIRPGGMGDLICAEIALQELEVDPRSVMWLIEKRSQPWAEYRELPHLCYEVDPLQTLRQVANRFEHVINTEQLFGLTQAYGLLARTRHGKLVSLTTNRGAHWADLTVPYDWRSEHETIAFARLVALALGRPTPNSERLPRPRMRPVQSSPMVLIAGRQSPSRRLGLDGWTAQITAWHQQRPFLIAAAPEDAAFAGELAARFPGLAQLFQGTFAELCEQIAQSEEILTMDGGAVHIASYFGVPTRALFTSGRDGKWRPLGKGSAVVRRHDLACQPCTKFGQVPPCPYQFACLNLDGQTSQ